MRARKVKGVDPAGPLAENAAKIVSVRLDELCGFVPKVFDPVEVDALHDMRIAAKRLRYILEVTGDLFGPYAHEARKRVKDLQDLLGEIHDCDDLEPRVLDLLDDLRDEDVAALVAGGPPVHAGDYRGLELLVVRTRARRRQGFDRFLTFWTDLERDGFRSRLEYALTERADEQAAA